MFDLIRNHQRILMLLLVLLIFPAFALFGISGYDNFFQGGDTVAKVGEMEISRQEYEYARQAQVQNMGRMLGDQFDPAMLDTPAARTEILEQLVSQRVLAYTAQERTLVVPDVAVRNAITEIPEFRDESGQFSRERYQQLLAAQGRSELQFENQIRSELAMQSIPRAVSGTAIVPRAVSRRLIKLNLQKRKFRTRLFKTEDFVEKVEVDTAKARAFYDENPELFNSTESMKIEYLVLSEKELAAAAEVTDAEVKEFYDSNAKKYMQDEARKARHILVSMSPDADQADKDKAREKIDGILTKLRSGADFAAIAKAESEDPGSAEQGGDLGFFNRETMAKPFADAAFSLDKDVISDVVETEFGLHVIQVNEIRTTQQEPLEKARPKVETEIRQQKGRAAFNEAADTFTNTAYEQPDSLVPTADKLNVKVKVIDQYQRFGTPDLEPGSPLTNPKVVRALFSENAIAEKKNVDAIETAPNEIVTARVIEHRPSTLQAFEDVEAEAISQVRAKEAAALAKAAGEAELAALNGDAKPDEKAYGEARSESRYSSGLPAEAGDALFSASSDKFPVFVGVELGQRGYMIQELQAIEEASDADIDKALEGFSAQAANAAGQQSSQGFLDELKKTVPIERFLDRVSSPASTDNY